MTTIELNAALKRLKAISDSLIDCDEKIAELSVAGTSDSYCVFECPKFEKG